MTEFGVGGCGDDAGSVVSCSAETGDGNVSDGSSAMLLLSALGGYISVDEAAEAGTVAGVVDDDNKTDASRRLASYTQAMARRVQRVHDAPPEHLALARLHSVHERRIRRRCRPAWVVVGVDERTPPRRLR
jgi:hypothetical protein